MAQCARQQDAQAGLGGKVVLQSWGHAQGMHPHNSLDGDTVGSTRQWHCGHCHAVETGVPRQERDAGHLQEERMGQWE